MKDGQHIETKTVLYCIPSHVVNVVCFVLWFHVTKFIYEVDEFVAVVDQISLQITISAVLDDNQQLTF